MNYYKLSIFFFYLFGKEEIKVERAVGSWKGGLMPYLEEFESRSKGPTTLRTIGLRSTPN